MGMGCGYSRPHVLEQPGLCLTLASFIQLIIHPVSQQICPEPLSYDTECPSNEFAVFPLTGGRNGPVKHFGENNQVASQ